MKEPHRTPYHKKRAAVRAVPPSARAQAHGLLARVLGERLSVDEALAKAPLVGAEADQRFAMALLLTCLQHLGQVDALLARYLEKPLPAKRLAVSNALRLGVVQLRLLDTPPYAAVHETVSLLKKGKDAGLAGLVNAVLQKLVKDAPALPDPTHNLPLWLRRRWEDRYGAAAVAQMAQVAATRAPLDLNYPSAEAPGVRLDAQMVRLAADHGAVEAIPGYRDGAFFVQDIAASYPARLLGAVQEHQVLDLCAAPGGKAMQLIRAGAYVTALDRSATRMRVLKENLARMGMQANRVVADAKEWEPTRHYDAVLLDAPCTATGTWRRHPEVVQLVSEADIAEMAALQRALLVRAWAWVKPGGKLVYCVCSLEEEEGEAQAAWFAHAMPDAQALPVSPESEIPPEYVVGNTVRTLPHYRSEIGGMDGFFAAVWQKK